MNDIISSEEEHELLLDTNSPADQEEAHVFHNGANDESYNEGAHSDPYIDEETEDSPYSEVRAAARNFDEDLPCNTIRAWTIGLTLVVLGAALNTLYSLRAPRIGLGSLMAQILAWLLGLGWESAMPRLEFALFGRTWESNPGPFNRKEHSVIVVMSSVAFSVASATDVIVTQTILYKQDFGIVFQFLLIITTQSLGYGIAGAMRKFLVYPAAMIWPGNLAVVTLLNTMHEPRPKQHVPITPTAVLTGDMPKYRWFFLVSSAMFVYYFIPGFLAQFLSVFAFLTWIAPNNAIINQLFGGVTGLSLLPLTFDWTQIAGFVGSPLIPPWHAISNTLAGVIIFYVGLAPAIHYSGAWFSSFLPMSDALTYDNRGAQYNVSRVLTKSFVLDEEAYKAYSPVFISTTFAISYGLSFASIASLIVYTYLHFGSTLWRQYTGTTDQKPDIHMKLMSKYKEVPESWYLSLFITMVCLTLITIIAYPTNLEWWAFLLALAISLGFSLPIGIVQATTNTQLGVNVLTEFIFGYIQPGNPLGLMMFKTYGSLTMSQALDFIADLKFGHYMKIPPRTIFACQVIATCISSVVQIVVLNWSMKNIDGLCETTQPARFTCPGGRVSFSASVIWGLIGPARVFSPGQIYSGLLVFFGIGAVAPIVVHLASKKYPKAKYIMTPLIFGGAGSIPPGTPLNYLSWGIVGFIFSYHIRKHYSRWWLRLNFLTSSGLDLGLALSTIVIFFLKWLGIRGPKWWGNTVVSTTMDFQGTAIQVVLPEGQRFGPKEW